MNKCFAVLIYLIVFAGSLSAQDGDGIFTQSYSYSNVDNSIWAERLTDDFIPNFSGDVQDVVLWMVFQNAQPADIFLRISEDDGSNNPNTATLIASGLSPATHVDTGDFYGGYVIKTTCVLPSAVTVSSGKTYWLDVEMPSFSGMDSYWLAQNPLVFGSTMWAYVNDQFHNVESLLGKPYDSFFELHVPLALERNTWGSIKASF